MATATLFAPAALKAKPRQSGSSLLARVIAALQARAESRGLAYLQEMDARSLRAYGLSDEDVRQIRAGKFPLHP